MKYNKVKEKIPHFEKCDECYWIDLMKAGFCPYKDTCEFDFLPIGPEGKKYLLPVKQ